MKSSATKTSLSTKKIVRISVLALLGFLLIMVNFPLPIFPSFIKLDIGNLPAIIAGMTMGPLAAVWVELLKNLIKIVIFTETVAIGEISNFICGVALTVPLSIIYTKNKSTKTFIAGSVIGIVVLCLIASVSNYFFVIPAYAKAFGGMEAIIGLAQAVNSSVNDLSGLIVFSIIPFNIIKGLTNVILGWVVYNSIKSVDLLRNIM